MLPLEPRDVIFTGTPAGVGAAPDPRWFPSPGATLVSTVAGIDELRHHFVAASGSKEI